MQFLGQLHQINW